MPIQLLSLKLESRQYPSRAWFKYLVGLQKPSGLGRVVVIHTVEHLQSQLFQGFTLHVQTSPKNESAPRHRILTEIAWTLSWTGLTHLFAVGSAWSVS